MKHIILMSGASGSGKSFLANLIKSKFETKTNPIVILSTDHYWKYEGGKYEFDTGKLGMAHEWNIWRVKEAAADGLDIIVDNTNTTFKEVKPYLDIAKQFNYWVSVMYPNNEWSDNPFRCFELNTHNVPLDVIERQSQRMDWNLEHKVSDYMMEDLIC